MSLATLKPVTFAEWMFWGFSALSLFSVLLGLSLEKYWLLGVPAGLLAAYLTVVDFRTVFFLLLAAIPLSTEIVLPNGFGTDLPTEPLIVGLMLVAILYFFRHWRGASMAFLRHPTTLLLLLHVGWIGITILTSADKVVSLKFFLAKIWYVITFYFLAGHILKEERDFRRFLWFILLPLLMTIIVITARHAAYGFSFADIYRVLNPFYRNHVAYAAILVVFLPFVWFVRYWYPRGSRRRWQLAGALALILMGIYLSYTRAAYLSVGIAAGAYFVIRLRLTRLVLISGIIVVLTGVIFLANKDRYLNYAPNYERTITHDRFNSLIEATYQLEDISTMERFHRWIAGFYMTKERPVFGFGPGNFYFFYRPYTVTSFQTYVSHNPEQSGIHSYYLMTLTEQGYPGLLIFLALIFWVLLRGESTYHSSADPRDRQIVMMFLLSFIIILALLIINDLIETDKIGPFFFIAMAVLVNGDLRLKESPDVSGPNAASA
jgi:O-antigen ligase